MHRILILPDIRPAGYPAKPKAGYRISGRISGKGRISGWILGLTNIFLVKYQINLLKQIIDFCNQTKHDLVSKLIFVDKIFLALFEEELYKLLDQLNIRRISGASLVKTVLDMTQSNKNLSTIIFT
jgi:hypothetical protein